jgi:hypothetical protein
VFEATGAKASKVDRILGHVHMAETGGTSLNGMLALNYERVCGHKGYSHSYVNYQKNCRFDDPALMKNLWGEGRVDPAVMDKIGYEDFDYISQESSWVSWKRLEVGRTHGTRSTCAVPRAHRPNNFRVQLPKQIHCLRPGPCFTGQKVLRITPRLT